MKSNVFAFLIAGFLVTACSSGGGGGGGGGNNPRTIDPNLMNEYSKPQAYNANAIEWIKAKAKAPNASLPSPELIFSGDVNSEEYKRLDQKGRDWLNSMRLACVLTNPPKSEDGEGHHERTERIDGGGCPIGYSKTDVSDMQTVRGQNLITINGTASSKASETILNPTLQGDTELRSMQVSMGMSVNGEIHHNGNEMTAMAIKMSGSGSVKIVLVDEEAGVDFRFEMIQSQTMDPAQPKTGKTMPAPSFEGLTSTGQPNTVLVGVGTIHTPEGDLSIGMRVENEKVEFRVGGKVMTPEELGEVLGGGPIKTKPMPGFVSSVLGFN